MFAFKRLNIPRTYNFSFGHNYVNYMQKDLVVIPGKLPWREFQNFFESIFIKPKLKLETVNKLDYELLEKISNSLPNLGYWKNHNIPPPILVIDETNKLFDFLDLSKENKPLFKAFLSWLKLIIQNNQFHVVLTSSEPFFLDWMEYSLHTMCLTPHVIGDLSIEEAKQFFVNHNDIFFNL
ncbi:hypothetical protein RhiirC2_847843 [Rhizophagus irregularis]|uniref:ATPase domain-containing protein n=1 Tax=Rhizophagus irregularis TaxID=588596 RepID=A0A2N1NH07_9GLOM|nr:hypothetical protein RhiirC2_847843 [Rhizophagus irregularis]